MKTDIQTSPQLKFRAVHKQGNIVGEIKLLGEHTVDVLIRPGQGYKETHLETWSKDNCHIDLFTGHTDKDGEEMYGGDVIHWQFWLPPGYARKDYRYWIVYWDKDEAAWKLKGAKSDHFVYDLSGKCMVIGNIHNPAALSEKARRMLK